MGTRSIRFVQKPILSGRGGALTSTRARSHGRFLSGGAGEFREREVHRRYPLESGDSRRFNRAARDRVRENGYEIRREPF